MKQPYRIDITDRNQDVDDAVTVMIVNLTPEEAKHYEEEAERLQQSSEGDIELVIQPLSLDTKQELDLFLQTLG